MKFWLGALCWLGGLVAIAIGAISVSVTGQSAPPITRTGQAWCAMIRAQPAISAMWAARVDADGRIHCELGDAPQQNH